MHEPFFPTGAHLGTSLDAHPVNRDAAWTVIDRGGADLVFVGHEHNYSRRAVPSAARPGAQIPQICTGSSWAPLKDYLAPGQTVGVFAGTYDYALVRMGETGLTVKVCGLGRELLDDLTVPLAEEPAAYPSWLGTLGYEVSLTGFTGLLAN